MGTCSISSGDEEKEVIPVAAVSFRGGFKKELLPRDGLMTYIRAQWADYICPQRDRGILNVVLKEQRAP